MSPIRPATEQDWPAIWAFFEAIVAEGETYAYPDDLTPEQARDLWYERPPGLTVVYDADGDVLGSAKVGPNRPGRGDHIGTASFMVAPEAQGRGIGRGLATWAVDWHREQGYAGIQFNAVVETNTAAVALWQDLGFDIVGSVPGAFRSRRHGPVGLLVMYLDLAIVGADENLAPGAIGMLRPTGSQAEAIVAARTAIVEAHYHLNAARERLQRARGEALYDAWLGGFVSSVRKVAHLDRSNDSLRNVARSLAVVRDSLEPLGQTLLDAVDVVRFQDFVEVWLDNPVTDVMTARRVKRALTQVDSASAQLVRLDSLLGRRLTALSEQDVEPPGS